VPGEETPVKPLPRIGIRYNDEDEGEFYNTESGAVFQPRGFNQAVLQQGDTGWHAAFNTGIYNPEAMEKMLSAMKALGANTLRMWIWGVQDETGFTGGPENRGLNGAYMENVADFLRRCTRHGIYLVPILDEVPNNAYYSNFAVPEHLDRPGLPVTGYTRQYLRAGPIMAKAAAIRDFIGYIRKADPGLLHTVFAWSLANEVFVMAIDSPFRNDTGEVTAANGKSYAMDDFDQRQACWDESVIYWADQLTEAVKAADPDALVCAGMWTSDAHGRPPVNAVQQDDRDPRFPPRPAALGSRNCRLDFIDVHIYPWDGTGRVNAAAHERDQVEKPAIVGEYGVFKNKSAEEAKKMMRDMLDQAYRMGYTGDLHWVWDMTMVKGQTWSAVEEGIGAHVMNFKVPEKKQR
jgi:hypothetical protein